MMMLKDRNGIQCEFRFYPQRDSVEVKVHFNGNCWLLGEIRFAEHAWGRMQTGFFPARKNILGIGNVSVISWKCFGAGWALTKLMEDCLKPVMRRRNIEERTSVSYDIACRFIKEMELCG